MGKDNSEQLIRQSRELADYFGLGSKEARLFKEAELSLDNVFQLPFMQEIEDPEEQKRYFKELAAGLVSYQDTEITDEQAEALDDQGLLFNEVLVLALMQGVSFDTYMNRIMGKEVFSAAHGVTTASTEKEQQEAVLAEVNEELRSKAANPLEQLMAETMIDMKEASFVVGGRDRMEACAAKYATLKAIQSYMGLGQGEIIENNAEKTAKLNELLANLDRYTEELAQSDTFAYFIKTLDTRELAEMSRGTSADSLNDFCKAIYELEKDHSVRTDYLTAVDRMLAYSKRSNANEMYFPEHFVRENKLLKNIPNPLMITITRSGLASLAFSRMIENGFDAADALDPDKLKETKKAVGNDVFEMCQHEENREAVVKTYLTGLHKLVDYANDQLMRLKSLNPEDIVALGEPTFLAVGYYLKDISQELGRMRSYVPFDPESEAEYQKYLACADSLDKFYFTADQLCSSIVEMGADQAVPDAVGSALRSMLHTAYYSKAFVRAKEKAQENGMTLADYTVAEEAEHPELFKNTIAMHGMGYSLATDFFANQIPRRVKNNLENSSQLRHQISRDAFFGELEKKLSITEQANGNHQIDTDYFDKFDMVLSPELKDFVIINGPGSAKAPKEPELSVSEKLDYEKFSAALADHNSTYDAVMSTSTANPEVRENLFGGWLRKNKMGLKQLDASWPSPHKFSVGRGAAASLITGLLLAEGLTLEEIYDPEKGREIKDRVAVEVIDKFYARDPKTGEWTQDLPWVAEKMHIAGRAMVKAFNEKVENVDFSGLEKCCVPENRELFGLSAAMGDLCQEIYKKTYRGGSRVFLLEDWLEDDFNAINHGLKSGSFLGPDNIRGFGRFEAAEDRKNFTPKFIKYICTEMKLRRINQDIQGLAEGDTRMDVFTSERVNESTGRMSYLVSVLNDDSTNFQQALIKDPGLVKVFAKAVADGRLAKYLTEDKKEINYHGTATHDVHVILQGIDVLRQPEKAEELFYMDELGVTYEDADKISKTLGVNILIDRTAAQDAVTLYKAGFSGESIEAMAKRSGITAEECRTLILQDPLIHGLQDKIHAQTEAMNKAEHPGMENVALRKMLHLMGPEFKYDDDLKISYTEVAKPTDESIREQFRQENYTLPQGCPFTEQQAAMIAIAAVSVPEIGGEKLTNLKGHIVQDTFTSDELRAADTYGILVENGMSGIVRKGIFLARRDIIRSARANTEVILKEYAAGNKELLASVLVSGILTADRRMRITTELSHSFVFNARLAGAYLDMLASDKEMMQYAEQNGLTREKLDTVKTGLKVADVYYRMEASGKKCVEKISRGEVPTEKETKEFMTLFNTCSFISKEMTSSDEQFRNGPEMTAAMKESDKAAREAGAKSRNASSADERRAISAEVNRISNSLMTEALGKKPLSSILRDLGKPGAMDDLEKMVAETDEVKNASPLRMAEILESYNFGADITQFKEIRPAGEPEPIGDVIKRTYGIGQASEEEKRKQLEANRAYDKTVSKSLTPKKAGEMLRELNRRSGFENDEETSQRIFEQYRIVKDYMVRDDLKPEQCGITGEEFEFALAELAKRDPEAAKIPTPEERIVERINIAYKSLGKEPITVDQYRAFFTADTPEAKEYAENKELGELFRSKVAIDTYNVPNGNPFIRSFKLYLRTGNTPEDKAFNDKFVEKILTKSGQIELFTKTMQELAGKDTDFFYPKSEKEFRDFYKENMGFCQTLFTINSAYDSLKNSGVRMAPEVEKFYQRIKPSCEAFSNYCSAVFIKSSPYYLAFPEVFDKDQSIMTVSMISTSIEQGGPNGQEKAELQQFGQNGFGVLNLLENDMSGKLTRLQEEGKHEIPQDIRNYQGVADGKEVSSDKTIDELANNTKRTGFRRLSDREIADLDAQLQHPFVTQKEYDYLAFRETIVEKPGVFNQTLDKAAMVDRLDKTFGPEFKFDEAMLKAKVYTEKTFKQENYVLPDPCPFTEHQAAIIGLAIFSTREVAGQNRSDGYESAELCADVTTSMVSENMIAGQFRMNIADPLTEEFAKARAMTSNVIQTFMDGRKSELARILGSAIKSCVNSINAEVDISAGSVSDAMIASECLEILKSDSNLLAIAKKNSYVTDDIIESINAGKAIADLYTEFREKGKVYMDTVVAGGQPTEEQTLEIVTLEQTLRHITNHRTASDNENKGAETYKYRLETVNQLVSAAKTDAERANSMRLYRETSANLMRNQKFDDFCNNLGKEGAIDELKRSIASLDGIREMAQQDPKKLLNELQLNTAECKFTCDGKRNKTVSGMEAVDDRFLLNYGMRPQSIVTVKTLMTGSQQLEVFTNDLTAAQEGVRNGSGIYNDVESKAYQLLNTERKLAAGEYTLNKGNLEKLKTFYDETITACNAYMKRQKDRKTLDSPAASKTGKRIKAVKSLLTYCSMTKCAFHDAIKKMDDQETRRQRQIDSIGTMTPVQLGTLIKNLNAQSDKTSDPQRTKEIGTMMLHVGKHARDNNISAEESGLKADDLRKAAVLIGKTGDQKEADRLKRKVQEAVKEKGPVLQ